MHSEIQHLKNVKAEGADSKEFLLDIHYKKNNSKKDVNASKYKTSYHIFNCTHIYNPLRISFKKMI